MFGMSFVLTMFGRNYLYFPLKKIIEVPKYLFNQSWFYLKNRLCKLIYQIIQVSGKDCLRNNFVKA